ncbi:hypothetical protein DK293_07820, partial [Vibrio cholerae]|nr:hypothetical protein [Vibrio cholerae]
LLKIVFGHFLASDFPKLESNKLMCVMRIHFCDYKFDYFLICGYDHVFIFMERLDVNYAALDHVPSSIPFYTLTNLLILRVNS